MHKWTLLNLINKNKFDIRVIFFNKIRFIEIDKCSLYQILNTKSSKRVSMGHFKWQWWIFFLNKRNSILSLHVIDHAIQLLWANLCLVSSLLLMSTLESFTWSQTLSLTTSPLVVISCIPSLLFRCTISSFPV